MSVPRSIDFNVFSIDFNVFIDSAGGEKDSIAYVKVGNGPQMILDATHGWILADTCKRRQDDDTRRSV